MAHAEQEKELLREKDGVDNRLAALHPDTWEADQKAKARREAMERIEFQAALVGKTAVEKTIDEQETRRPETRRSRMQPTDKTDAYEERLAARAPVLPDPNPHARYSGSGRDPWLPPVAEGPLFPAMAREDDLKKRINEGLEVIDSDLAEYVTRRCNEIVAALSSVKVTAGDQCQACDGLTFNTYEVCDECVTKLNTYEKENVNLKLEVAGLKTDNASMELKLIMYRSELKELKGNG